MGVYWFRPGMAAYFSWREDWCVVRAGMQRYHLLPQRHKGAGRGKTIEDRETRGRQRRTGLAYALSKPRTIILMAQPVARLALSATVNGQGAVLALHGGSALSTLNAGPQHHPRATLRRHPAQ